MQLSGPKSPESPESPVDRSSFTAATVVEMFLEDIERTADDCLSQSAEFAVLPDIGVVIFPDVAVREALAEVGEPMLAQQAPGGSLSSDRIGGLSRSYGCLPASSLSSSMTRT